MGRKPFPLKWKGWINEFSRLANAYVLVNGSHTQEFALGRGLRQGNMLSWFIFLIAAEDLNVTITTSVNDGLFFGVWVGKGDGFNVSHLQFAKDNSG